MENYIMSQMKAMTQIMEIYRMARLIYSGESDDCAENRMRVSALRESFKAQVLSSEDGPKKIDSIMLTQLDCLYEMVISSYNQGLIVQTTNLKNLTTEITALSESLRGLIRCEVSLDHPLSPPKYSGSSSESDDFYSSMSSKNGKEKRGNTNTSKKPPVVTDPEMEEEISVKKTCTTSFKEKFRNEVILKMTELGLWKDGLEKDIPTYWDNFNNFVVFNTHFFSDSCWTEAGYQIWQCVSQVFSGKSIALQGKIQNDDYRSPTATLVYGESPWIRYTDNSVHYTWNVEFTMFCTGNVSERHRVAGFECQDKVVVDMFAGIGYFTLPFLVHAKAKQVIACEWNPVSVEALKRNLSINKMTERCTVLEGDVRNTCPRGVADHINLGLIPSCEEYWISAADILKPSGGVMHVHGNVTSFTKGQNFSIECEMCLYLLQEMSVDYLTASIEHCLSDFKLVSGNKVSAEKTNGGNNVKWKKFEWFVWGLHVSHSFCEHLSDVKKSRWTVQPSSLHRVKAYAPRIDHLVIDICCRSAE